MSTQPRPSSLLFPALTLLGAFTVLTGVVYPLTVTALAQALAPWRANGSLLKDGDRVVGSALVGQSFTQERYFHGRPSASTPPYDGANSTGSNLGPMSPALRERVSAAVTLLRAQGSSPVPADLVTTSASGLDPDVSPEGARFQVPRVARARGLSEEAVGALVARHTEQRTFSVLGEPRVNVLRLNLALDALAAGASPRSN